MNYHYLPLTCPTQLSIFPSEINSVFTFRRKEEGIFLPPSSISVIPSREWKRKPSQCLHSLCQVGRSGEIKTLPFFDLQVHQHWLWCYEADIEELCLCDKVQHRQPHSDRGGGHLKGGTVSWANRKPDIALKVRQPLADGSLAVNVRRTILRATKIISQVY